MSGGRNDENLGYVGVNLIPSVDRPLLDTADGSNPSIEREDGDGERNEGHEKGSNEGSKEGKDIGMRGVGHVTEKDEAAVQAGLDGENGESDSNDTYDEGWEPDEYYRDRRGIDRGEAAKVLNDVETVGLHDDVYAEIIVSFALSWTAIG